MAGPCPPVGETRAGMSQLDVDESRLLASWPATVGTDAPPWVRRWRRLTRALAGAPGVALAALAAGLTAFWFASDHDLLLLYADARSHLTIARRLVDGPNAGLVQLGTVWLPLPHLALVPFVSFRSLWSSGVAAVPLDLVCLVVQAVSVFSLVRTCGMPRWVGWVGVTLLLTNPSLLYLHTTGMSEPVLFAAMLLTTATLARWAVATKPYSGGELAVFCGLPAAAALLARYDGWAYVAAATVFVLAVARMRWGRWRYAIHLARCFVTLPVIAALWWMWFNWINFGDPLEFQRGRYSAEAQQELLSRAGLLPEEHDLLRSLGTYTSSVGRVVGWIVVAGGALGMVVWARRTRLRPSALAPWLLVIVPFGFYVASLYTGQIALRLDEHGGQSMFNLRYGLAMQAGLVVFAALGVGSVAGGSESSRLRIAGCAVVAVAFVAVQAVAWWPDWRAVPVVAEGLAQADAGASQRRAADWLHEHAREGTVLIDDSVNPLLPVIDADLNRVAAPFSGKRWDRALQDPSRARWVFVDDANPQDAVRRALRDHPGALDDLELRFQDGPALVYESTRDER